MKSTKIFKVLIQIWILYYHIFIPILVTISGVFICRKYKIYLWNAEYYNDMLTAIITFLSIILSVFGILIPTVFVNKKENGLVKFFMDNADIKYFVNSVKRIMLGGIFDVFFVCILYSYDVIPRQVYIVIMIICLGILLYFLCGSYKYLSLLLRLVLEDGKPYTGKTYNNEISQEKRNEINEMLERKHNFLYK